MAVRGSLDFTIELKDSGGTYRDISVFVNKVNEFTVEAITDDVHGFGEAWKRMVYSGVNQMSTITISGVYDDGSNTPYALWSLGATRLLRLTWGNSHTSIVSVILSKFTRTPVQDHVTTFSMDLQPASSVAEA